MARYPLPIVSYLISMPDHGAGRFWFPPERRSHTFAYPKNFPGGFGSGSSTISQAIGPDHFLGHAGRSITFALPRAACRRLLRRSLPVADAAELRPSLAREGASHPSAPPLPGASHALPRG